MDVSTIIAKLHGTTRAAERLGLKRQAVVMWRTRGRLPAGHVPAVARALGVPDDDVWPAVRPQPQQEAA